MPHDRRVQSPPVEELAGGYTIARVDAVGEAWRVTLRKAGARSLRVLFAPRDDAKPRAGATERYNVVCLTPPGQLPRAQELAYKDLLARLALVEERLPLPVLRDESAVIAAASQELLALLGRRARVRARDRAWRELCALVLAPGVAARHARAIARGGLAFDFALTARSGAYRAGVTLNRRALPDLDGHVARLIGPAATPALALARHRGVELTFGCVAAESGSKLKVYAEERRHGARPLGREELATLAAACGVPTRVLPARVSVACMDVPGEAEPVLKVYVPDPPPSLSAAGRRRALAFARKARRAGGFQYFTIRHDPGRARHAMNAVFRAHTERARRLALEFAAEWASDSLAEMAAVCEHAGAALAVTAVGIDMGGGEVDVYVTPVLP